MVRLKVTISCSDINSIKFQFHDGTIKSSSSSVAVTFIRIFQFHDGTIKRQKTKGKYLVALLFQFHDGTIKSPSELLLRLHFRNFNSTMVRLKEIMFLSDCTHKLFQFHDGTIKSADQLHHLFYQNYFNSTMVRLKGRKHIPNVLCFSNFNSTMVRLKAPTLSDFLNDLYEFQFHDGTIKSKIFVMG